MAELIRVTIMKDADKLAALIQNISKQGLRLQRDIHRAALGCIWHMHHHNNVTPARQLIDAVPAFGRKNALTEWFENFGPCSYDKDSKVLVFDTSKRIHNRSKATAKVAKDERIAKGMQKPFWDFRKEPEYKQFDLKKSLAALIAKAERSLKKEQQDLGLIPQELLEATKKLA